MRVMSVDDDIEASAQAVHDELGAGFTENVYHSALQIELSSRGVEHSSEGTVPVLYKGQPVGRRRPDLFVKDGDETIIVELKAGSSRGSDQLLQYLGLLGDDSNFEISKGVLIQFNEDLSVTFETV